MIPIHIIKEGSPAGDFNYIESHPLVIRTYLQMLYSRVFSVCLAKDTVSTCMV